MMSNKNINCVDSVYIHCELLFTYKKVEIGGY